ncbi:MAG: dihydrolipoyllysine-residue acetyltransferase [Coxiella sp. RIFCSPHIGHO2_12_FULL_42_15]|nr:MAG: dihydrolipoyllysine-residue acetyltransferase [Coxiella sp. RIFCSPHIGHO2_12_FULL_42_15]
MANAEQVKVPDIGGAENVEVIEVFVKAGDTIKVEDPLMTLEGDKATMDVPAPKAGKVIDVKIKVGDKVSQGSVILSLEAEGDATQSAEKSPKAESKEKPKTSIEEKEPEAAPAAEEKSTGFGTLVHAGPGVRRIAQEFGVDLTKMTGTGEKGRILKEDVQKFVKTRLQHAASGGFSLPVIPSIDFSKFGEIEPQSLSKIKKISGANLHRNWISIPHVTQFGDADITELEVFRQREKPFAEKQGVKLTPLVFLMKAVVAALKEYPHFNASLEGETLILKKYFHIGVAVDTPNGLVVPVIRDVDRKGLFEIAKELAHISAKARDKGLSMTEMQGGCFSISSLGGIGGTAFTPIINAPEVAILGVSRSEQKPVYIDGEFQPRLMLPLSLSYDHRVIDGADGARFLVFLTERLSDIRTLLL